LTIPLNYILTKAIGYTGPAVADLIRQKAHLGSVMMGMER